MTSFLVIIGRIYSKQFKRNYRKNQNGFVKILLNSYNLHKTLNILKKHQPYNLSISENIDCEWGVYLNA